MKNVRIFSLVCLFCLALTGCEKEPWLEITTDDASLSYSQTISNGVTVTSSVVRFSASFEWRGLLKSNIPQSFGSVLYGKTNNLSVENNVGSTCFNEIPVRGAMFSFFDGVTFNLSNNGGPTEQNFVSGDTMYYRAYAKVINGPNDTSYIYGVEKFAVMTEE